MVKTVDTTSTSSSSMRIELIGCGDYASERVTFDLVPAQNLPESITLAAEGSVMDEASYELSLLLEQSEDLAKVFICINDGETKELRCARVSIVEGKRERRRYLLDVLNEEHWGANKKTKYDRPWFRQSFGFVRIGLELWFESSSQPVLVSTQDIACRSLRKVESEHVERMLLQLLDADDIASRWMFSHAAEQAGTYALLDGGRADYAAKSLSSMIDLMDCVLREYEHQEAFFRTAARCQIVSKPSIVPLRSVRRVGRSELLWLSKNMDTLQASEENRGIAYQGACYLPRKVETSVRVKTYECYENQCVLGFLAQVLSTASTMLNALRKALSSMNNIEAQLRSMIDADAALPALAIVRTYVTRERSFINTLQDQIGRAHDLQRRYSACLPNVSALFSRTIRRTKTFTEVQSYYRLYTLMQEWNAIGDYSLAKESLALHVTRSDKLYEYYVLYNLLKWLSEHGFTACDDTSEPIRCGAFTSEGFYKPETGIATVYELVLPNASATLENNSKTKQTAAASDLQSQFRASVQRAGEHCADATGGKLKVKLYYQPIIHANAWEDEGIRLHRLSYKNNERAQNYWTPDYLLELTLPNGQSSYHVIDAKYRRISDLISNYPNGGALSECVVKYRLDTAGSLGERVSTVWLLAGKHDFGEVRYAESSPWAASNFALPRSGVALLSIEQNNLDAVFAEIFKGMASVLWPEVKEYQSIHKSVDMDTLPNVEDAREAVEVEVEVTREAVEGDVEGAFEAAEDACGAVKDAREVSEGAFATQCSQDEAFEAEEAKTENQEVEVAEHGGCKLEVEEIFDTSDLEAQKSKAGIVADSTDVLGEQDVSAPMPQEQMLEEVVAMPKFKRGHKKKKQKQLEQAAAKDNKTATSTKKPAAKKPKAPAVRKAKLAFDLDDATRNSIAIIVQRVDDQDLLFNDRWAKHNLGLERPLLRKREPSRREAAFYESYLLADEACWLTKRWSPVQKNKARMFAEFLITSAKESESSDS